MDRIQTRRIICSMYPTGEKDAAYKHGARDQWNMLQEYVSTLDQEYQEKIRGILKEMLDAFATGDLTFQANTIINLKAKYLGKE